MKHPTPKPEKIILFAESKNGEIKRVIIIITARASEK
jgi:hypothetical protein